MAFDISDTNHVMNKVSKAGQAVGIDSIRYKIIEGKAFYAWDNSWNAFSIAKDSSWNAIFYSGGTKCHKIKLFTEADASINYRVFEFTALVSTPARTITPMNYNRNVADTFSGTLYKGNAGNVSRAITTGTEIRNKASYGLNTGSGVNARAAIGIATEEYSFITHPSKYYLLHIYNRGPNKCALHVHIRFTEYNEALTS